MVLQRHRHLGDFKNIIFSLFLVSPLPVTIKKIKGVIFMSDLSIEVDHLDGGIVEIRTDGDIDANTYENVETCVQNLFNEGHHKLIFNLGGVGYISSAGAGVFIQAVGAAQDNGGNIVLLNPSASVKDVFEVLGLAEIFPYATTLEESLGIF